MNEYARKSGWEFNLITYKNLDQFLNPENYERCLRLLTEVDQSFKQVRADIIRLLLLKENGGMWVDSSTFFIDNLNWIDRINTTDMPVLNRISKEP